MPTSRAHASKPEVAGSWRDLVTVHPAADLFPMMSDVELLELGNDIKVNGLRNPLVLWTPESSEEVFRRRRRDRYPKKVFLLDGRNRLAAMEAVGIELYDEEVGPQLAPNVRTDGGGDSVTVIFGGDPHHPNDGDFNDPYVYVVSANLRRRHLTTGQKRDLLAELLKASPEKSDRAVAKMIGVSPTTAGDVRHELERAGDVSKLDTRIDSKGRKQPTRSPKKLSDAAEKIITSLIEANPERSDADIAARVPNGTVKAVVAVRASRRTKPETLKESAAQIRAKVISGFCTVLHADLPDTLEDLVRILGDERAKIALLPIEKRTALARGCLRALGVGADDLKPIV